MSQNKIRKFIAILFVLIFTFAWIGCDKSNDLVPEVGSDEIALQIKLDTKEDIGLLIVNYKTNDSEGSGGTSNADKSLLKHGEIITYTLNKQDFANSSDIENLSIQFTIITKYIEPNYENRYPLEYTKPIEAITLNANYGETYFITISGDKINGYKAILES